MKCKTNQLDQGSNISKSENKKEEQKTNKNKEMIIQVNKKNKIITSKDKREDDSNIQNSIIGGKDYIKDCIEDIINNSNNRKK